MFLDYYNNNTIIMWIFLAQEKVTIAIPKPLYDEIQKEIKNTGFSSPSEWVRYILRQAISSTKKGNKELICFPYLGSKK